MSRRLIILTAVMLEARAIARALGMKTPGPGKPMEGGDGRLSVELHIIGIRAVGMPAFAQGAQTSAVILAGLAGALDPSLAVGDVVIDGGPEILSTGISYRRGKICWAASIVATPQQKAALFRETQALAVDMESGVVRGAAEKWRVPFIHIRGISDTADEVLDPAVLGLIDDYGRVRAASLAALLLRRPRLVSRLTRLGNSSHLAAENMAKVVAWVVENGANQLHS